MGVYPGVMQALYLAEQEGQEDMYRTTNDGAALAAPNGRNVRGGNRGHYEDGRPVGHAGPVAVPLTPEMVARGALGGGYGSRADNEALSNAFEYGRAPAL